MSKSVLMSKIELKHSAVKLLVIHCSATRCNKPFSVDNLIATGMARFGQPSYHYYIRRNGAIVPILPENVRGAHARHYNSCSLGICYEGGLDEKGRAADTRTPAQRAALIALLRSLKLDYPNVEIVGHCELEGVHKDCPSFSCSEYRDYFKHLR